MDIDISEAADINVEVQALNLEGIKQNLLDYVQDKAKIDIDDSVDKAYQSAKSAENYAGAAAQSAIVAGDCASQASASLGNYYTKAEVNTALAGKANVATTLSGYGITDGANTALSNLNSNGQMVIDSQNGTISNCILDIPQNIKLTLENNVLTLKSGSVITLTGSTYSTVTTTQDNTLSFGSASYGKRLVVFPSNSGGITGGSVNITNVLSGTTLPETGSVFFNTNDKLIYTHAGGEWNVWNRSYPICIVDCDSEGNVTFAKDSNGNDMIFNGAGFIGHHAFVYPNVTVFYPNGYSNVKHLNSVKITTNQLYITELATNRNCLAIGTYTQQATPLTRGADLYSKSDISNNNIYHYITSENVICSKTSSGVVNRPLSWFVDFNYNGTTVTDFTIRQPYQGARNLLTDDLYKQIGDVETLLAAI